MKTLALDVIHNEIDVLRCVNRFVKFDDTIVIESAQNTDFSDRLLLPLDVHELLSVVLLDRNLFSTRLVDALFHHGIGTVTNLLAEMVLVDIGAVGRGELITFLGAILSKRHAHAIL